MYKKLPWLTSVVGDLDDKKQSEKSLFIEELAYNNIYYTKIINSANRITLYFSMCPFINISEPSHQYI